MRKILKNYLVLSLEMQSMNKTNLKNIYLNFRAIICVSKLWTKVDKHYKVSPYAIILIVNWFGLVLTESMNQNG